MANLLSSTIPAFAMAANAARDAYRALRGGDWVGAAMVAASLFAGGGGLLSRWANAVVRGGRSYKSTRAAGDGRWTAGLTALTAAAKNPPHAGAVRVTLATKAKDYGLIISGAAHRAGAQRFARAAELVRALRDQEPSVAIGLLGKITGTPRLTTLGRGLRAIDERDVALIVSAADRLPPELKGAVMTQLDRLAEALPRAAQRALQRQIDTRLSSSANLVSAVASKDRAAIVSALARLTNGPNLGFGQGMEHRHPAAIFATVSTVSPELRAAATAQLMQAAKPLPPEIRAALDHEMQARFTNAAKLIDGLSKGSPSAIRRALGSLSTAERQTARRPDHDAIIEGDVPEIVNAVWHLSPELRSATLDNLDRLSAKLPDQVGHRLRAEMRIRFAHTRALVRAVEGRDAASAMVVLAKITGGRRLEAIAAGVDTARRKDVPALAKAIDALPPEVRGRTWEQLDRMVALLPTSVREAWQHEKDRRLTDVRALARAVAERRPRAIIAEMLRLDGSATWLSPDSINGLDPSAAAATLRMLSPHARQMAASALTAMETQLAPPARQAVRQAVAAMIGVPLGADSRHMLPASKRVRPSGHGVGRPRRAPDRQPTRTTAAPVPSMQAKASR